MCSGSQVTQPQRLPHTVAGYEVPIQPKTLSGVCQSFSPFSGDLGSLASVNIAVAGTPSADL